MTQHIADKSIVITGAGGGFGRLLAQKAAAQGARVTCGDINERSAQETVESILAAGGHAQALAADVTRLEEVVSLVQAAINSYGAIDVMVNNAGIMPLAFFSDHATAHAPWTRCIDINIKGVLNGMVAAYDPMMAAGRGQIVNLSSICGNFPVLGAAVYGASKAAVNFLSESFRLETRGKIKVTTVKPTGVPATALAGSVINRSAVVGLLGANMPAYQQMIQARTTGDLPADQLNPEEMGYVSLGPEHIVDAILHVIDQPWGVSIGEITIRAAGDYYIL